MKTLVVLSLACACNICCALDPFVVKATLLTEVLLTERTGQAFMASFKHNSKTCFISGKLSVKKEELVVRDTSVKCPGSNEKLTAVLSEKQANTIEKIIVPGYKLEFELH